MELQQILKILLDNPQIGVVGILIILLVVYFIKNVKFNINLGNGSNKDKCEERFTDFELQLKKIGNHQYHEILERMESLERDLYKEMSLLKERLVRVETKIDGQKT